MKADKVIKLDKTKAPARPAREAFDAAHRTRRARQARIERLTEMILELEGQGVTAMEPSGAAIARRAVRAELRGPATGDDFEGFAANERLFEMLREREDLKKLQADFPKTIIRAENDLAEEIRRVRLEEWAILTRGRSEALLGLRDANAACEKFKADVAKEEGLPVFWPSDPSGDWFFSADFVFLYTAVDLFYGSAVKAGLLITDPR